MNQVHINTGCHYDKKGQEITIIYTADQTHFIDHSRMLSGTMNEANLGPMEVVRRYILNNYSYLKLDLEERMNIER